MVEIMEVMGIPYHYEAYRISPVLGTLACLVQTSVLTYKEMMDQNLPVCRFTKLETHKVVREEEEVTNSQSYKIFQCAD